MENSEIARDAFVIAREINYIKERTKRQVLSASIEIGEKLCEAKALVPHGEWEAWLKENVAYSQSTANNLMRICREYGDTQIGLLTGKAPSEVFGELTYTQAVVLLGLPMDERMALAEEKDVAGMSSRELEREIAARKAAQERADTLSETLQSERNAQTALNEKIAELEKTIEQMRAEAEAPAQADIEEYILREDADSSRIAAVEAARKEAAAELQKAKEAAETASARAEKLKAELEDAAAAGKAEAEKAYSKALADAEAKARTLEEKLQSAAAPAVQKFAIYFEELKRVFGQIMDLLDEAEERDRARMRGGILKVLFAMTDSVREE